jgi:N,N'-diacetyllegionaminate synthase
MYARYTPLIPQFKEKMNYGSDATMLDLITATSFRRDYTINVKDHCDSIGIEFFSTPFSISDVEFLEELDVKLYKTASFELAYPELMHKIGLTGKPIIMSTGMASLGDIELAIASYQRGLSQAREIFPHPKLKHHINLLHCVSNYPANPDDYNLKAIKTLKRAFQCGVGVSDHTPGVLTSLIAIALEADLIEKHITLDQNLPGPDHSFSLTPDELRQLVAQSKSVVSMLGDGVKRNRGTENGMSKIARRSLIAISNLPVGHTISSADISVKRPGYGISPHDLEKVIGMKLTCSVNVDQPLEWSHFQVR